MLTRDAITPFPAKPAFEAFRTKHRLCVSLPAFTGGLSGAILSDDRDGTAYDFQTGKARQASGKRPSALKVKPRDVQQKHPGRGHREFV